LHAQEGAVHGGVDEGLAVLAEREGLEPARDVVD